MADNKHRGLPEYDEYLASLEAQWAARVEYEACRNRASELFEVHRKGVAYAGAASGSVAWHARHRELCEMEANLEQARSIAGSKWIQVVNAESVARKKIEKAFAAWDSARYPGGKA